MLVRCLRLMKILKPPSVRLKAIVDDVATRTGVPVKATWQIDAIVANAFALTASRDLVFTDRLLKICNDEEIAAICAHEIAHLGEPNIVLAGRLVGSLYLFPLIFVAPLLHRFAAAGLIPAFLGMISISGFAGWLTRRMERRADRLASAKAADEGVYAGALEKIYRENQLPAVNAARLQTHPNLYDRMLEAGVKPDYPRPNRPKSTTLVGWLYMFVFVVATAVAMRG
jgi:Zn-dependent protease with chaperone function